MVIPNKKLVENPQDLGTIDREKFLVLKKIAEPRRSESQLSKENEQKDKQLAWPDMMTQWQVAGAIPSPPKLGERSKLKDKRNLHRLTNKQLGVPSESIYSSGELFGEVNRPDQGLTRLVVRLWEEDINNNSNSSSSSNNNNRKGQNLGTGGAYKETNLRLKKKLLVEK
jgi:hypothetical protein